MMVRSKQPPATATTPQADDAIEQQRRRQLDEFRQTVERIGERNRDKDPDQILAEVTEIVEEVRQEMYERERRPPVQRAP